MSQAYKVLPDFQSARNLGVSLFVKDVLKKAGLNPPQPGDVIAEKINYADAYGHVGTVAAPGQTVLSDSAAACVSGAPAGTIDITDYGFRLGNWVDPLG